MKDILFKVQLYNMLDPFLNPRSGFGESESRRPLNPDPKHWKIFLKTSHLTDVDYLENVVVGGELIGADVEMDVEAATQEVLGQLLHLLGPGGAPHAPSQEQSRVRKSTNANRYVLCGPIKLRLLYVEINVNKQAKPNMPINIAADHMSS